MVTDPGIVYVNLKFLQLRNLKPSDLKVDENSGMFRKASIVLVEKVHSEYHSLIT